MPRAMGHPSRLEGVSDSAVSVEGEIVNSHGSGSRLRYPLSATAAEKPLPRKGRGSFPSWTSPVRPRSPALVGTP